MDLVSVSTFAIFNLNSLSTLCSKEIISFIHPLSSVCIFWHILKIQFFNPYMDLFRVSSP